MTRGKVAAANKIAKVLVNIFGLVEDTRQENQKSMNCSQAPPLDVGMLKLLGIDQVGGSLVAHFTALLPYV